MKTIRHTGIVVKDLDKMLHFYVDLLGLKVVKRNNESSSYIDAILGLKKAIVTTIKMAAEDGSLIELLYFQSHPGTIALDRKLSGIGMSHIAFTVNDIDVVYFKLLKEGILFNSAPQKTIDGSAKVAFCKDFENNFIELVEELHS